MTVVNDEPGSFWRLLLFSYATNVVVLAVYILIAHAFDGFVYSACRWDCGWYLGIASQGYDTALRSGPTDNGQANWAFFPAFPLLLHAIEALTGWPGQRCGVLLNNALLPLMAALIARYAWRRAAVDQCLTVLIAAMFPYSLYFRVPYTETLYGTLLIGLLLLLRANRLGWAAVCAACFTATRPTGAPILALIGIAKCWQQGVPFFPLSKHARRSMAAIGRCVVLGAAGGIGLLAYMTYLHVHVGDAWAFKHIEAAWGRHGGNPVGNILQGLRANDLTIRAFLPGREMSQRYLALCCIAGCVLVAWGILTRLWLEAGIVLTTMLLATSTGLWSSARYLFANPAMLVLVAAAAQRLSAQWRAVFLCFCAMIQVLFVVLWYQGARFLM